MIRNLKHANEVAREALPSLNKSNTAKIDFDLPENGDTIEASASLRATPACATCHYPSMISHHACEISITRKAPQSFPPSPVIPTANPCPCIKHHSCK